MDLHFLSQKHQGMPWCGGVLSGGHRAKNEPRVSHPVNRGERRNYMGIVGLVPCVVGLSFFGQMDKGGGCGWLGLLIGDLLWIWGWCVRLDGGCSADEGFNFVPVRFFCGGRYFVEGTAECFG